MILLGRFHTPQGYVRLSQHPEPVAACEKVAAHVPIRQMLVQADALPEDGKRYELADGWLTELSLAHGTTTQLSGSGTSSRMRQGWPEPRFT